MAGDCFEGIPATCKEGEKGEKSEHTVLWTKKGEYSRGWVKFQVIELL
jgi:hypothetical protein